VDLLRKHGPSTATRLAERLGVNSGTASYHLRRLGAAGFVEEDVERGNARERWWRSVHRITRLTGEELAEREPEAVLAYMQSVAALYNMRTQQALNEMQTMSREWRGRVCRGGRRTRQRARAVVALGAPHHPADG
jgi:predicted ArsR family transcriptional regulator